MINRTVDSFNNAIKGILTAFKSERNLRFHFVVALIVLTAAIFFNVSRLELLILLITITLVIFAEMVNSAIELVIDKTLEHHPAYKRAKDVAAGAVLITAINALAVGYIIFWDKFSKISFKTVEIIKSSDPYIFFLSIIIILIITIIIKALTTGGISERQIEGEKGSILMGGMPSGHSTIGFAIATMISVISEVPIIIFLSYLLALIIAQSRVDSGVHKLLETVVGAIIGTAGALIIFRLFYL